jgi:protein-S-isoprenylcysteine O-methyltransferase Ste14
MFQRLKKKAETRAITALIVIPLVVCVIAFLVLACYFSLLSMLSPALAALVTAAAGIVLMAFVLLIARLSSPHSSKSPRP